MHTALDGKIGRIRVPGGHITPDIWAILADLADSFGDGDIHITTRGNLQVRGIQDTEGFAAAVRGHGLLPSPAHDRVRNIIVSPLGFHIHDLAQKLDQALLESTQVTTLSGRTLFGIDAGQGDIFGQQVDFGVIDCGTEFHIIIGGELAGVSCQRDNVPMVLVRLAETWAVHRGKAWRVSEKPGIKPELLAAIGDYSAPAVPPTFGEPPSCPIGWFDIDGSVHLGAGLRFGVLPSQLARMIGVIGAPVTVTPWHSLVIHGLNEDIAEQVVRVLAPQGLIFDVNSTWLRVTACTGLPGCAKSPAFTRDDAAHHIARGNVEEGLVHFSGCERRCGHPLGEYTDYLATAENEYEVSRR